MTGVVSSRVGYCLAWSPSCFGSLVYITWVGSGVDFYFWQASSTTQQATRNTHQATRNKQHATSKQQHASSNKQAASRRAQGAPIQYLQYEVPDGPKNRVVGTPT